jgi:ADP-heptose:LPS heptosyltransferase
MKILVVRFRQMGDAILATCIFNTIKRNDSKTDTTFILNERLAPLFMDHPAIDHIITFSESENYTFWCYLKKVWKVVHQTHYDVIIDMRSTLKSMFFSVFSPSTKYRIGLRKWYTHGTFNYLFDRTRTNESAIDHDLMLLSPLNYTDWDQSFLLSATDKEKKDFRDYMVRMKIDFSRPVVLMGVTSKLQNKTWSVEGMVYIVRNLIQTYPQIQIIFNYAPGIEELDSRRIYKLLNNDQHIFIDIHASSPRQLLAMSSWITFYFGNEGGARHIAHSQNKPSFVIMAPQNSKKIWLPQNGIPAEGISVEDIASKSELAKTPLNRQYALMKKEMVWMSFLRFIDKYHIL